MTLKIGDRIHIIDQRTGQPAKEDDDESPMIFSIIGLFDFGRFQRVWLWLETDDDDYDGYNGELVVSHKSGKQCSVELGGERSSIPQEFTLQVI